MPVDEIQHGAWIERTNLHRLAVATHALRHAPRPNRHRSRREQAQPDFAQHPPRPLLFRRADVGERPSRLKSFTKDLSGAALSRRLLDSWHHGKSVGWIHSHYRR